MPVMRICDSLILARVTCGLLVLAAGVRVPAEEASSELGGVAAPKGAQIYRNSCASCHGPKGQGTEDYYPDALTGDDSIGELAELIADTMPEEDPESCVGEDALAVARYIHKSFYSEAAQLRNRPPRIVLARLTANQLQQSLADLYARLDGVPELADTGGLSAAYYEGKRAKKENLKLERVDPVIDFNFGHDSPGGGIDPKEFHIRWSGGLKADVTGHYELIVRSSCSFVCDFGANDRELINNHVQSGDKTEFRRDLTLIGGRVYPISIRLTQRERKTEQPPARISLSWIPPGGVEEIIPPRNLVTNQPPPTFALQTDLPPDDRSYGYERGISVNRQWDESTTAAALEFAGYAAEELWPRYQRRHRKDPNQDREQLRQFLTLLVETAFRSSQLSDDLRKRYVDAQVAAEPDDAEAIKRVLLIALKSPRFLYPTLDLNESASQRAANRLALTLYDSLPTESWLIEKAENGQLKSEEAIRQAAEKMVDDYRVRGKTRAMFYQWLDLSPVAEIAKDQDEFGDFDEALVHDLRRSLNASIDQVVWSDTSDYRDLFRQSWAYTTPRLAEFYGEAWNPAESGHDAATGQDEKAANEADASETISEESPAEPQPVADSGVENQGLLQSVEDPEHRFGLLTHPLLMSKLAYHDNTSPIHRGVFLIRHLLGRTLRPPNEAFAPLSPDLHPDLTTRERVALQTSPESCQVCHSKINALGFTLENYDAVGRYRTQERNRAVDANGSYATRAGEEVEFAGPADLADYLATSEDATRAFVSQAFEYFVKQPIAAYGTDQLERLTEQFRNNGYSIRNLLVEIAVITALEASEPPGSPPESSSSDSLAKSNQQ